MFGPDLITGVFKGREFSQAEAEGKSERFQALKKMKSLEDGGSHRARHPGGL